MTCDRCELQGYQCSDCRYVYQRELAAERERIRLEAIREQARQDARKGDR